jgi:hypothetical protein
MLLKHPFHKNDRKIIARSFVNSTQKVSKSLTKLQFNTKYFWTLLGGIYKILYKNLAIIIWAGGTKLLKINK